MTPKWEADTLFSPLFDDLYFSKEGGKEESKLVFWEGNGFPGRLTRSLSGKISIGELGFGTGLNFLTAAEEMKKENPALSWEFYSVEKYPLPFEVLEEAVVKVSFSDSWDQQTKLAYGAALKSYEEGNFGFVSLPLPNFPNASLQVFMGDVLDFFKELTIKKILMDAWFLDGFSPAKNPEMWNSQIFQGIRQTSSAQATFATFTSAGFVRRGLEEAGFIVQKEKGFGKKRERIKGHLP